MLRDLRKQLQPIIATPQSKPVQLMPKLVFQDRRLAIRFLNETPHLL